MENEEGEDETENEEEDEENAGVTAQGGNVTNPTESSVLEYEKEDEKAKRENSRERLRRKWRHNTKKPLKNMIFSTFHLN